MQDQILTINANLRAIIENGLPHDKSKMIQFVANLDERFPDCPRTVRAIFESVYERKFNEKFVW